MAQVTAARAAISDLCGQTYVVVVGPETIASALSCHALQSVATGPESYVVSFIEEQGLCIGTGVKCADCGHNNGVVAAVVLLLKFAVHPG
jgi:presenilin-like A22 family membrane protease